jgi:iron complex outermembrane receptor protein
VRGVNGGDFDGLRSPTAMDCAFFCGSRQTKDSWDDWAPKFGIDYQYSDDILLYGAVTKGFKSGGTNSLDLNPSFNPEEIWSYEVGVKSTLWNDRLRLNGAAFYYDYSDLQVSTFSMGTTLIENAASAEIMGLEVDASALLTDQLVWNVGLSLLDTEYDDFVTTFGGSTVDVSGNNMVNAPEVKLITNLRYDWELAGNTAFVFGQVTHQDDVFHSQFEDPLVGQDSYTLVDLRAGYRFGENEEWEVAAIVKNATDEEYFQNSVRFTSLSDSGTDPARIGAALGYPAEGRSYGLQLRFTY